MNAILIGYRGTGKSTVGKRLADELSLRYVCLDEEIVRRAGKSIPRIVEEGSWDHFRDLEEAVVSEFAQRDGQVLDTGGGVVTRSRNVERLRKTGIVFLLESTVEDIAARIGGDTERPSLTGEKSFVEEVEEVLAERRPLYRNAAHYVISTSRTSVEKVVARIASIFRQEEKGPTRPRG